MRSSTLFFLTINLHVFFEAERELINTAIKGFIFFSEKWRIINNFFNKIMSKQSL